MSKSIWLITHDNYIDRRIFFFADVFRGMGYSVKLFPSFYFDLLSDEDPDYVCRPVDTVCLKSYAADVQQISPKMQDFLSRFRSAQERYRQEHGVYAPSLRALSCPLPEGERWSASVAAEERFYSIQIEGRSEGFSYSSLTDGICILHHPARCGECAECEAAILEYLTRHRDFLGKTYSVGSINVRSSYNQFGEMVIYSHHPSFNRMCVYNMAEKALYEITPIPFAPTETQQLGGHTFHYGEYEKIVYDFSPILENIRRALSEEVPEIVYVADLPTLPLGLMLKEAYGCRLMVDCHEWWYKQARLWEKDFVRKIELSEQSEAEFYPKCDLCITVGQYLADDMAKCYRRPFEVVYSCMSAQLAVKAEDKDPLFWQKRFGLPVGAQIAVFQGSMTSLRNLDNLARATKWLGAGHNLVVVGGGPYEAEFRKILEKEGSPEKTFFAGWVAQNRLMQYTVNADLGVLPYSAVDEYFSYSVPNKLMEYFEAAVPMLYDSSMKEISMVAGENRVGVGADLMNPEEFGKTMDRLLSSPEELEELRKNYAPCKDKFRYDSQRQAVEGLMRRYFAKETAVLA